jgi:hypothetical protein
VVDYKAVLAALDKGMEAFNAANLFTYSYNGVPVYAAAQMDLVMENMRYVPTVGRPYQETALLPADTAQPAMGNDGVSLEKGVYQVSLHFPRDEGAGDVLGRAQLIRQFFKRNTLLSYNGTTVSVERVPSISPPRIGPDWYSRFVSIPYFIYS